MYKQTVHNIIQPLEEMNYWYVTTWKYVLNRPHDRYKNPHITYGISETEGRLVVARSNEDEKKLLKVSVVFTNWTHALLPFSML